MISRVNRLFQLTLVVLLAAGLLLGTSAAFAFDGAVDGAGALQEYEQDSSGSVAADTTVLAARDKVDLESHDGYSSEYIFGMTKGVMRSTLVPALKPVALLFTVPLDLVFLPFAAIGGFFR